RNRWSRSPGTQVSTTADAEPHGGRVADERQFDGFAGRRLALAGEQQPGSAVDAVAAAARPADGIARPAGEPPAPVPHPLFALFYLVEIRHRQLLGPTGGPFAQPPSAGNMQYQFGNFWIVIIATKRSLFAQAYCRAGWCRSPRSPARDGRRSRTQRAFAPTRSAVRCSAKASSGWA